jgi:hypothetical protein
MGIIASAPAAGRLRKIQHPERSRATTATTGPQTRGTVRIRHRRTPRWAAGVMNSTQSGLSWGASLAWIHGIELVSVRGAAPWFAGLEMSELDPGAMSNVGSGVGLIEFRPLWVAREPRPRCARGSRGRAGRTRRWRRYSGCGPHREAPRGGSDGPTAQIVPSSW